MEPLAASELSGALGNFRAFHRGVSAGYFSSSASAETTRPVMRWLEAQFESTVQDRAVSVTEIHVTTDAFDENEFVALIPRMRSLARYLCRNATDAEDLTQTAMARAWRRRDTYTPGSNMKAWLLTIVRNQFYSDKRRAWRVTWLDPLVAEETLAALSNADAPLELEDVRRAMEELPVAQSQAFNLIVIAGLPYEDAAMIGGCATGTIKSRVHRARKNLAAILAEGDLKAPPRQSSLAMGSIMGAAERARGSRYSQGGTEDAGASMRLVA